MKGQNLRIFIDGKVVGAARNLTFELTADTQDISTKDSPDDWAEYEVTNKSWSANVDALVRVEQSHNLSSFDDNKGTYYYDRTDRITIHQGEIIRFKQQGAYGSALIDASGQTAVVKASRNGEDWGEYQIANRGIESETLSLAIFGNDIHWEPEGDETATYEIIEADSQYESQLEFALRAKQKVTCRFSYVNGTIHRDEVSCLLTGDALITGMTINSANKDVVSYTAKLTGEGPLLPPTQ